MALAKALLLAAAAGAPSFALDATAEAVRAAIADPSLYGYSPHNLAPQSETFSNAAWNKSNATATANRLSLTTGGTNGYINSALISLPVGPCAMRVRARAGTSNWVALHLSDFVAHANGRFFNLATSAAGVSTTGLLSGSNVSVVAASATANGDGTVDCIVIFNLALATTYRVALWVADADGALSTTAGQYVDLSFAQLNLGPTPTAYVATTTTALGPTTPGWLLPGSAGARLNASARASVAMQVRQDGGYEFAPHNLFVQSEAPSLWTGGGAATSAVDAAGVITLTFSGSGLDYLAQAVTAPNAAPYTFVCEVQAGTKTGSIRVRDVNGAATVSVPLSSTWTEVSLPITGGGSPLPGFDNRVAQGGDGIAGTIRVRRIRFVAGASVLPYVPTTTAAVYAPAIDWLSGVGRYGVRSEEARTNLALWSADMSNAAWQVVGTGAAKVGAGAALGSLPMYRINVGATGGAIGSASAVYEPVGLVGATQYTVSAVVRSVSGTSAFRLSCGGGGTGVDVGSSDLVATTTPQTFSFSFTPATTGTGNVAFRAANAGGAVGDIEVGAIQVEAGAFATSPILTYGAAATRAADIPPVAYAFGSAATVVADFVAGPEASGAPRVLGTNASNNAALVALNPTNAVMFDGTNAATSANVVTANALSRAAAAYNASTLAITLNGSAVATGTHNGNLATATQLILGADDAGGANESGQMWVTRARVAAQRLPNATLQALAA